MTLNMFALLWTICNICMQEMPVSVLMCSQSTQSMVIGFTQSKNSAHVLGNEDSSELMKGTLRETCQVWHNRLQLQSCVKIHRSLCHTCLILDQSEGRHALSSWQSTAFLTQIIVVHRLAVEALANNGAFATVVTGDAHVHLLAFSIFLDVRILEPTYR